MNNCASSIAFYQHSFHRHELAEFFEKYGIAGKLAEFFENTVDSTPKTPQYLPKLRAAGPSLLQRKKLTRRPHTGEGQQ
jgi:hypothetical protein